MVVHWWQGVEQWRLPPRVQEPTQPGSLLSQYSYVEAGTSFYGGLKRVTKLVLYIWREPLFSLKGRLLPPFWWTKPPFWGKNKFPLNLQKGVPAKFHKMELLPNLTVQKIPNQIYQPASAGNLPILAKLPVSRWSTTLVYSSLCLSFCPSVRAKRGIWSKEGILWLFTIFYLHRKFSIFLRNYRDCKAVDPYNARKRYAVIETSDFMRNIPWLASCFCKTKKPNKKFS